MSSSEALLAPSARCKRKIKIKRPRVRVMSTLKRELKY